MGGLAVTGLRKVKKGGEYFGDGLDTAPAIPLRLRTLFNGPIIGVSGLLMLAVPMVFVDCWHLRGKIEKLVQFIMREGLEGTDDKLLVDIAFASPYAINLAD
jgi:hypothetical protein